MQLFEVKIEIDKNIFQFQALMSSTRRDKDSLLHWKYVE